MIYVASLDMDGTLIDNSTEYYNRLRETWHQLYGRDLPLSAEEVRQLRLGCMRVGDFLKSMKSRLGAPEDFDPNAANQVFYGMRERRMRDSRAEWLAGHSLYPGAREMMRELDRMGVTMAIVTSRSRPSAMELLGHFRLAEYVADRVIDRGAGGREEQFAALLSMTDVKPDHALAYDDFPENLDVAASLGMHAVGAPQGYASPGTLDRFRCASPEKLASVAREIFSV